MWEIPLQVMVSSGRTSIGADRIRPQCVPATNGMGIPLSTACPDSATAVNIGIGSPKGCYPPRCIRYPVRPFRGLQSSSYVT